MILTKTEFEIALWITLEKTAEEISAILFRSVHTIHTHVKNIKKKNGYVSDKGIVRDFVLNFGDPKKHIAIIILIVQIVNFLSKHR